VSDASNIDTILSQAGEREKVYDWLGATEFYRKALSLVSETDFLKRGEVQERVGYAFYRAAMQAEGVDQFNEMMRQAAANYGKAKEFYKRLSEHGKTPRMLRCDAMIAYTAYWFAFEVAEKKRWLNECWRQTKDALIAFEEAGDSLEFGKTYNQLSSTAYHIYALEWNFQVGEEIIREAIDYGERTITLLSSVGNPYELARAYVKTAIYLTTFGAHFIPELDERERHDQKGLSHWGKAYELSEETALLELLSISGGGLAWNIDKDLEHYEKALGCVTKTKDKYLIGTALDALAYLTCWKSYGTDDPDKRVEIVERALQYAEDAKQQFSSISFVSPRGGRFWSGAPHADYYYELALIEIDLGKRRDLLEKAVMAGTQAIKLAESTGYHDSVMYVHHVLGGTLGSLVQIETNLEKKRRLLEDAMEHRNESIKITEEMSRFGNWTRGIMWSGLANLQAELANVEKDSKSKEGALKEAISNKERSLQLCVKENSYYEKAGDLSLSASLGSIWYSYGGLLSRLYELTKNNEHQTKAVNAFEEAAGSFQKLNMFSRLAECYWKAARGYGALSEHLKSAEYFSIASNNYTSASEKIPQLKNFYLDHVVYMQAWSEIEKARQHHARQEYGSAEEHYEKAAVMHRSLKQWSYLAPNYLAWARIENAEDLSRKEQSEEALETFRQAAKLFTETKKSLQTELSKIEDVDENQMAINLLKVTDLRQEYCMGRIFLEEGKILDKGGEHSSSSEKYGSATQIFEKIIQELESEHDKREFKLIATLSRAWQKMTQAEAEASPALYMEASQLFEEAKELSPNEKTKMLALGHSRFCRALEAGTKFADTREIALHATAMQHLESATNYYTKADFQAASEYAKATRLLFDAYVHMDNASKENDPEKKAKLFMMAEKVLQKSSDSYIKAKNPAKSEQALKLLKSIKDERELAVSLTETLHAPIISSTTTFPAPTPTFEKAVGLEKFEHAEIQANILTRQKELKVGDSLDLEIELVNAGKGPALLTKITEVFPKGFEVIEKPQMCRVEDSCINMKGRRLDPLKTEEIKLVLKPRVQGAFLLKPKVLYLDENGKYKAYEPEPINITVKELGIKGWLRGER